MAGTRPGRPNLDGAVSTFDTVSFLSDYGTVDEFVGVVHSVIRQIARVSKPGRRVYSRIADLQRVYNGLGISILSTPRGVMSDNEARAANVGGEVLCQVF